MSQRILKYIHIGVGRRGRWPTRVAVAERGFVPVALCDLNDEALAAAREATGLTTDVCFRSLKEAIARVEADCCILCTPTFTHVPLAIEAIDAGLPVLMEKAMATHWAEARRLQQYAREKQAIVCVSHNCRYQSLARTVARAIREPDHPAHPGQLFLMCYTHHRVRPHPQMLTFPFAAVWDLSCHHFDTMLSWFGPIRSMRGHSFAAEWSAYEHPNNVALQLLFESGVRVEYVHTVDGARSEHGFALHGSRGALVCREELLSFSQRPTEQYGTRPVEPVTMEADLDVAGVLADFHRYVTDGVEPPISVHQNLEVMAMCEMAVRVCTQTREVFREELAFEDVRVE